MVYLPRKLTIEISKYEFQAEKCSELDFKEIFSIITET